MTKLILLVAAFLVSNSSLLVLNKLAISAFSSASSLLFAQFLSTVVLLGTFSLLVGTRVNHTPSSAVIRSYLASAGIWCGTIYSNVQALRAIGVNSLIVLRCLTPLLVCVLDWLFLGRTLPNKKSLLVLCGIFVSGALYAKSKFADVELTSKVVGAGTGEHNALLWCVIWLNCFLIDATYIKYVVETHPCNRLERTLYQNTLALPFLAVPLLIEGASFSDVVLAPRSAQIALALSCLAGTILSFSGMSLRSEMSATSFTILGITCKMGSTLLNELFVQPERDFARLSCVFGIIIFSAFYRQAPLKSSLKHFE